MLVPASRPGALLLALFSMVCWGSWSNTLKFSEGLIRFEMFYFNWSLTVFLCAVFCGLSLGMLDTDGKHGDMSYLDDWREKSSERYLYAFVAGLLFNVANICLCKGIAMLGLSLAFPITIGTALVLGTLVTYAVQPSGSFGLLLLGVAVAFAAVCLAALAQRLKDKQLRQPLVSGSTPREIEAGPSLTRKLVICVTGGVLMGLWCPLATLAEADPGGLSAYGEVTLFTLAVVASSGALVPALLAWPLEGGPGVPVAETFRREYRSAATGKAGIYSVVGGAVWALGTLANVVAGNSGVLSAAESYAIGQCANMIAILWGALYFREFRGTSALVKSLLVLVCCLYAASIACVALAGS